MKTVKIFAIVIILLAFLPLTVSCDQAFAQEPTDTSVMSTPTSTLKILEPTPTSTKAPTNTPTSIPLPTLTSTPTPVPIPTDTPTMTPFATLDYAVEYPFNTEGMTQENVIYETLSFFILVISQEYESYDSYDLPRNRDLNGFPSSEKIWLPEIWAELSLPAFCRYYPYATMIHNDEIVFGMFRFSLDYTFLEAQTLVGVDCSIVDVSMFPPVTH